jgi:hypothetical protein
MPLSSSQKADEVQRQASGSRRDLWREDDFAVRLDAFEP